VAAESSSDQRSMIDAGAPVVTAEAELHVYEVASVHHA
jgi:hypothetical protein